MTITFEWRGDFDNAAVNALHAAGFNHHALEVNFDACGFKPTTAGLIAL
ncbi:hypothetical protein [Streptomyces sp. NL15-2K]|nr:MULTISPECIES: hypothetical protein [Actinomycetes]WKX08076.1 hypothetical protein Q4V64_11550 [Kutzneria buriramensis]GCB50469.1 hypothetical protein SNL152K_7813 [Streptomyces sp. NL15-2K]